MQVEMDDYGGAKDLAGYRIDVAKQDLASAVKNLEDGEYRTANNRAYYAIYHAITACLALEHKAYKTHGQTIGAFNKEFIHTGVFSTEYGKKIKEAQDVRHSSDYDDFYVVSKDSNRIQVENAKEIVGVIEEYILFQISEGEK